MVKRRLARELQYGSFEASRPIGGAEFLDPAAAVLGDVDVPLRVDGDAVGWLNWPG